MWSFSLSLGRKLQNTADLSLRFTASESSLKNVELSEIESLGTKVAVRYGVQLKLLQSTTDGVEDLTYLLKYCKFFLQGQQRSTDVTLRILEPSDKDLFRFILLFSLQNRRYFFRASPVARDSHSALESRLPPLAWKTQNNNACSAGYLLFRGAFPFVRTCLPGWSVCKRKAPIWRVSFILVLRISSK